MTAPRVMNPEKLAKLQEQAKNGSSTTTIRRKTVAKKPAKPMHDDRKMQSSLQKLKAHPIPGIQEVNMFDENGHVLHFEGPRVTGAVAANTFVISGEPQEKELTELLPGILGQLGPESLETLRKMAAAMQQSSPGQQEIPELVEDFENAAIVEQEVDA